MRGFYHIYPQFSAKGLFLFSGTIVCLLCFPQIQDFLIEIGERIKGRPLNHSHWRKNIPLKAIKIFVRGYILIFLFLCAKRFFTILQKERRCQNFFEEQAKRDFLFDNFKGILIFLVVFGHFIENFQSVSNHESIRIVWQFIYVFHMPAFAFVSGFFAKPNDEKIFEKVLEKQIIPLIVFQILYEAFFMLIFGGIPGAFLDFRPFGILWYLLSLACWRISFQLFARIKGVLVFSLLAALYVGRIESINGTLSLSRTIVLFPFFIAGYFFKEKNLIEKIVKRKNIFLIFLLAAVLVVALIYVWKMLLPNSLFTNDCSYRAFGLNFKKGIAFRFLTLSLAFLCSISIMTITPQKKCFLSEIGRNSIMPYLSHMFFLYGMKFHFFNFYNNLVFTFLGGIAVSAAIVYFFGKDIVSKIFNDDMKKISRRVLKRASLSLSGLTRQ